MRRFGMIRLAQFVTALGFAMLSAGGRAAIVEWTQSTNGMIGVCDRDVRPVDGSPENATDAGGRAFVTVDVALRAVGSRTLTEEGPLPLGLAQVCPGSAFIVEIWVSQVDGGTNGIAGGSVDLLFDAATVTATSIDHGNVFSNPPNSDAIAAGLVDDLGGATMLAGKAVGPNWALLARVSVTVTGSGPFTFALDHGAFAFALAGGMPPLGNAAVDVSAALMVDVTILDDGVACTDDTCDEINGVVGHTPNDGRCDNGLFCDGVETCDAALGCLIGVLPTFPNGVTCLLYVDQNAVGANDGSSWADAYVDLQDALAHATAESGVSDIWVAGGTYMPAPAGGDRTATFTLLNGVTLYGGFAGGEIDLAQRDIVLNETILSGDLNLDDIPPASASALRDDVRRRLTSARAGQSLVDFQALQYAVTGRGTTDATDRAARHAKPGGFRSSIRSARKLRSGAAIPVSIDGAELRVGGFDRLEVVVPATWSTMSDANVAAVSDNSLHVVTISGTDATAILDGFTITAGNADGAAFPDNSGGGVFNIAGLAVFRGCRLQNNHAAFAGAGMFNVNSGNVTMIGCGISGNTSSGLGGGVYNFNGSNSTFTGCAFVGNRAETLGGGMANVTNSSPILFGTSFVSNIGVAGGGGVFNFDDSNPTLDGCDFTGNLGTQGGAVSTIASAPVFTNCSLNNNTGNLGGGLFEEKSGSVLSGCQINGNSAFAGGAFFGTLSQTEFDNCVIRQNDAAVGGAMYNHQTAGFSMCSCDISENVGRVGGAMYNTDNASLDIVNTTITGNTATGDVSVAGLGGAMVNIDNSDTALTNCVLCSNTAAFGGAMLNISSSPQLSTCTLSGNTATQLGDAMFNGGMSFATVTNSIVWNVNVAEFFEDATSSTTITFSDVFGGWPGSGNIALDPQFVTNTCDGLRLNPASPCVDAGDNALLPLDTCDLDGDGNFFEPISLDLAGNPRINATVDLGVFENP